MGRSCVELLKAVEEALDALFEMHLPIPLEMVRSLVEGMDSVLQRYIAAAWYQSPTITRSAIGWP